MAKDAELDRLKATQDTAFKNKQSAYQAQQKSWDGLVAVKNELNKAYEEKQRAYSIQESAWQECQRIRANNGPRIDQLNAMQESAYENMKRAFDDASSAYNRRDGATAKMHSEQGHRYKTESQGYVNERRRLVDEIKRANDRLASLKPDFERAKQRFSDVKSKHDRLKSEHVKLQEIFKRAKNEFDQVSKAFKTRLELVKKEQAFHREADRRLAEKAGVPFTYLDSVKVTRSADGGVNFLFGGYMEPDGLGHGHYATDRFGKLAYQRDPFDPHGSQNYIYSDNPRFSQYGDFFGESCTYKGYSAVKESGIDKITGRTTIDVYYGGKGGNPLGKGHGHDIFFQDNPNTLIESRPPK